MAADYLLTLHEQDVEAHQWILLQHREFELAQSLES